MQEGNADQPPSLSQLLRQSYLAEARAQQRHSEVSRSDGSSTRLQIYGSLKGKAEGSISHGDPQLPDLSAFLSQEELDKSVNLARLAIGHEPHEERGEVNVSVTPLTPSSVSAVSLNFSTSPSIALANPSPAPLVDPHAVSFMQPAPELKELPATAHTTFISDKTMHKASSRQDDVIRTGRNPGDAFGDLNRPARNPPYGPETQSKKEFLNKAADFIEELSSLFKANSSKRIRPRACKAHRSRVQNKSQNEGAAAGALGSDNRERTVTPTEMEKEGLGPAVSHQTQVEPDPGPGQAAFQDCRTTEEPQYDNSQEVEEEAESCAVTESPYTAEAPASEPPRFIQKLKSREVPEGSKVQLDCIVRGHPVPEVRWFCEGKELENSPDIQIVTSGELHSLIIAEAFEEDTGRYSCFASNFYGTDSTSAEIYVEGASSSDSEGEQHFEHMAQLQKKTQKSARSSAPSSSQSSSSKEEVSLISQPAAATEELAEELPSPLQTSTSERPDSELSGVSAHAAQEKTILSSVQVRPTLSQDDAEPSEASASVAVMSTAQLVQASASLPLNPVVSSVLPVQAAATQTPHPENQTSNRSHLQVSNGPPGTAAPSFTKSLQDITASEGQLVVLECHVKGSPQVDWHWEGKLVEDSPKFRILQKKDICTLVIAEVFPEDSGMFTCTASNTYGTVFSSAELTVKGSGRKSNHMRPFSSSSVESSQVPEPSPSAPTANLQAEVPVMNTIKPRSSTIRLDPLVSSNVCLDPLNTSVLRLDPNSYSVLRPDLLSTSLPGLESTRLSRISSCLNSHSTNIPSLDPLYLSQNPPGSSGAHLEPQNSGQMLAFSKPFTAPSAVEIDPEVSRPSLTLADVGPKVKWALNHQNGSTPVVPLPDPPPNSCLKTGTQTNHKDSRSGSRAGRRVHFRLPEDEETVQSDTSSPSDEDAAQVSASRDPPPVLAKPKLDPAQLQLLHNQVLMEQQQDTEPQAQPPFLTQPGVQSPQEGPWSPRMHREPHPPPFQPYLKATTPAPPLTTAASAPPPSSAPAINSATASAPISSPAPSVSSPPSVPQLRMTSPFPAPQPLGVAPVAQMNTIHASHFNLSPAALARTTAPTPFSSPQSQKLSTVPADSGPALQQLTSPAPLLRSTHASLMNLAATSHSFSYTRPKEFIAAQTFSPVMSPSPTESPVPLLQELAAELSSSAASSPTLPPFSPPPRTFPTRVLMSPTSPPSLLSSPTLGSAPLPNSVFALRAQSPPQASSPTSSSSTPSPILNPVAFLSAVLPSLVPSHPTNAMGLPKGAPSGPQKKVLRTRLPSAADIRDSKDVLIHDIEKRLRFKDDAPHLAPQQEWSGDGRPGSRPPGPRAAAAAAAAVVSYTEAYKVSNFEQRLMSEIEFRLERTPVEESDDEVQHDDVPTGKCIAPIFDKKLKNFRAVEGGPVTFSCKIVGIPVPKVYWFKDGKQILKKNVHHRRMREADGTCALHIECATGDDDGNYTVMAANPQGRVSCSGHLIVQTGPPRHRATPVQSQRVRARIQEVEGEQTQERVFRPHFLQAPGDLLAHEGRLCRLDCKVSGLPSPELMWLLNGRPVCPSTTHKMLVRENGVHSLVIDPVTQGDGGSYTCIASNKAGQSSFSLDLKVVEKEMTHPPQFVEKLQNMGIPEGSPVRMECRVMGVPPPLIFWKKDNDTILKSKDRISMTQDATGYVCLLIQPTTKDDAGWYTVSAKNEAGVVACTCRLDIYAQWHHSIPAQMKTTPRAGSRYAALTGQGLDVKAVFSTAETSPILFSSSPPEATLESEEL